MSEELRELDSCSGSGFAAEKKKILVLGGSGYIGRHLCAVLSDKNLEVITCSRAQRKCSLLNENVRHFSFPLQDTSKLVNLINAELPDIVIHLASVLVPSSGLDEFKKEIEAITTPTLDLISFLSSKCIKFVYFSSGGAVYGQSELATIDEEVPRMPESLYGQNKLFLENLIELLGRRKGLDYLIIRPSNPYGGSQSFHGNQGLIGKIFGAAIINEPLKIWDGGKAVRDYIYIDDLCSAALHLISKDFSGIFNIGSGQGYSILEILTLVEETFGHPIPYEILNSSEASIPRNVLNIQKILTAGAPEPRAIEQGLSDYRNMIRSRRAG